MTITVSSKLKTRKNVLTSILFVYFVYSNMPTFGLPASAYELNSNTRLTIRFDREMFNTNLFDSEIEISPAGIGNNMAFRFNRNDLFRPPT